MKHIRSIMFGGLLKGVILLLLVLFSGSSWANTHHLTGSNNESDWTCTLEIEGDGVTFLQEDPDYKETTNSLTVHKILYHVKKKATLTYTIKYSGSTGDNATYYINGEEGSTFTRTVELKRDEQYALGGIDIQALITWPVTETQPDGSQVVHWEGRDCQFLNSVELWKPLYVDIVSPYGGSATLRRIKTQIVTPFITEADENDVKNIGLTFSKIGDVNVKLVKKSDSPISPVEQWVTTDASGSAQVTIPTSLDAEFNQGTLSGSVLIKAVKDGMELEKSEPITAYFARVKDADNVHYVGESGEDQGPVETGTLIKKGEHIQIGTALATGGLQLSFCNGETVAVNADMAEGFYAIIGKGELIEGANLLSLDLRNKLQDFKDMPRRALRMQIYKQLGGLVDDALGIPGEVGIVTETPGSAIGKWLTQWGEKAYEKSPPKPSAQSQNAHNSASEYVIQRTANEPSETNATQDPPINMNDAVRTDFSFQTDGSIYVENMGGNLQLAMENGSAANVTAGASVMVIPARGDQTNSTLSKVATSTTAWTTPATAACVFSPTNGAILNTQTPAFTISTNTSSGLVLATARLFMDGNLVTDWFDLEASPISGQVPVNKPLAAGIHTLLFQCLALNGNRRDQSITFHVTGKPPVSENIMTTPFSNGVWVSWQTVPAASSYNVWRASSTNGTKTLLTTEPRQQPGFLDENPLPENYYWIETKDAFGQTVLPDTPISSVWSNGLPAAPAVSTPEDFSIEETPMGARIMFNDSLCDTTRWQLSRGSSSNGTFTALETNEQTLVSEYVDTSVLPGTNYYYKLTALTLDGEPQENSITNIAIGTVPDAPTGLTGVETNTAVQLNWNCYADFRATSLRVYGYDGKAFVLLASLPLNAVSYIDSQAAASDRSLYQVRAVGAPGEESEPSSVGVDHYDITTENAIINLPSEETRVHEGDGIINIPVTRTGNLGESASILYRVWDGNKGQAVEDVDFVKSSGTLTFTTNQTDAVIPVQLLTDSESEWDEGFSVDLGQGYGSTTAGDDWSADVVIEDSDLLMFADYNTEITVDETNGPVKVWIDRIWPSQHQVSVDVAISDPSGNAVAGQDYVAFTTQQVVFAAGSSRQALNLELLDDDVKDGTKSLNVHLQNPQGGASTDINYSTLTINIRDNDSHPGQLVFQTSNNLAIAESSTNSIQMPIRREGGTDGSIDASAFMESGNLPWDAISFSTVATSEGQDSTVLTANLDRTGLDTNIAPCCVVSLMNNEYPYNSSQIVLVFHHKGILSSPFATWIAGYDIGENTGAMDDPDSDGFPNIIEYARGTNPNSADSHPSIDFTVDSFGFTIDSIISPEPNLAVISEFCENLKSSEHTYDAGWWTWNSTNKNYDVEFYKPLNGESSYFGRLKFIWLGN